MEMETEMRKNSRTKSNINMKTSMKFLAFALLLRECSSSCQAPITPQETFSCSTNDADFFRTQLPADLWWTATNPPSKYVPGLEYIKNYYFCCRICVWTFNYPRNAPISFALDPDLNCNNFRTEFANLDTNVSGTLTFAEFSPYMHSGPNRWLVAASRLDPLYTFHQTDLNRDEVLSLEEYLNLDDGKSLNNGPLGGLFRDSGQLQMWYSVIVQALLNVYMSNGWDPSLVREPTTGELVQALQAEDLDGSQRISLEEHYFKAFADTNGDGYVSKSEYYLSLYKKTTGGTADNQYLYPINFNLHDLNGDGLVSFLERKFIAADIDGNYILNSTEWVLGDFIENYNDFSRYDASKSMNTVDSIRYFYYTIFHDCSMSGSIQYNRSLLQSPWSRACFLEIQIQNNPPFVEVELNQTNCTGAFCNVSATSENTKHTCTGDQDCVSGRGCSYFGFCTAEAELQPTGYFPRLPLWKTEPKGYNIDVIKEVAARLNYNITFHVVTDLSVLLSTAPSSGSKDKKFWPPPLKATLISNFKQLRYSPQNRSIQMDQYQCTDSLWAGDGFVIVVKTTPPLISRGLAMFLMLFSPSFINFLSIFFFFIFVMGHIFWIVEHRYNALFRKFYAEGVMDGLWYTAVTVTTVGYGDKVPTTLIGKLFGSFWMIFGLICFGLFSGAVVDEINTMQEAANIQDASGLVGVDICVLENTYYKQLSTIFGFKPFTAASLEECGKVVLNGRVAAMLVPHADLLQYFLSSGLYARECGNPLKVVGDPLLSSDKRFGLQNAICFCDTCDNPISGTRIYASTYLSQGMSTVLTDLSNSGFLSATEDTYLSALLQPNTCGSVTKFEVGSIIACFILLFCSMALNVVFRNPFTRGYARAAEKKLASAVDSFLCLIGVRERDPQWVENYKDTAIIYDDEHVLQTSSRRHFIATHLDRFQSLSRVHNANIIKLSNESVQTHSTIQQSVGTQRAWGTTVILLLSFSIAVLILVWGIEVRPSALGIPPNAVFTNEL